MTHEFRAGDPVLVQARFVRLSFVDGSEAVVEGSNGSYYVPFASLISDDRQPDESPTSTNWLPGHPGDLADFTADAENEYGDPVHATRWMRGRLGWWAPGMGGNWIGDDDVPTDAVLVLPAPTRT